ncbi:MAG: family 16 glycosylhydrolase [Bacteroidota bacterium]|nr:family 16 glycosylhydrolase [Bacteroidota bacterium]
MKTKYFTLLILCCCIQANAQIWNLVWSDEFDSGSVNSANWKFEIGNGSSGWGNNELEYYTNRTDNAVINNGSLLIIAKKESYSGKSYTSARLKSQDLKSFTYGKIEARIKLPLGKGLWPAFWMLGNSITTVGWPKCGEIDIMEHINTEAKSYGTIHWFNTAYSQYGGNTSCDVTQYHVYSIQWDASAIKWYLDGVKYFEGNIASGINGTEEFHLPHFILLNFAVGGNWPGNPDGATPFPDTMFVDYVRVSQLSTTSVSDGIENAPKHFALLQNYPNPFNPTTTFSFDLPIASFVSLTVFDMMGREVETVVSEKMSAGSHTKQWNAINVSGGVYFYRLRVDRFMETKKLLLLK